MTNFAILRVTKLRTAGNVAGCAAHILRERKTPNADPARRELNRRHVGPDTAAEVLARVHELVSRSERKAPDGDRVLALEYLVTASPEAFRKDGSLAGDRCRAYLSAALEWIKKRHVNHSIVLAETHMDETSPHMQVIVVPLFEVDTRTRKFNVRATGGGRQIIEREVPAHTILSAKRYVGGRTRLGRMQTNFAEQVGARFGLERGIKRSKAQHTTIKTFYGAAQRVAARMTNRTELPALRITDWAANAIGRRTKRMQQVEEGRDDQARATALALATRSANRSQARALNARNTQLAGVQAALTEREQRIQADEQARRVMARHTAVLLKAAYTREELFQQMGLPIPTGKADIFDLLMRAGQAEDFPAAVALVTAQCPPEAGSQWESVSGLVERHEAPLTPSARPTASARRQGLPPPRNTLTQR